MRVAIVALAVLCASGGPSVDSAKAQYPTEPEITGERQRPPVEREQRMRERTPLPRPIVAPEGQQTSPALREECAWLGQRIVSLLFRDDPMTGNDFLPFYTRFECPEEHLTKAFACVVRNGAADNDVLADRIAECWADPTHPPTPASGSAKNHGDSATHAVPPITKPADGGSH
jgi:hypothetical protein